LTTFNTYDFNFDYTITIIYLSWF